MAIERWDPFRDFLALQDEVGRLFERVYGSGQTERRPRLVAWTPVVDMADRGSEVVVKAELPGLEPDDVEILVEEDALTIKGERSFEQEHKEENYYRIERRYGSFERRLPLPANIKRDDVTAGFANGVLEVTLPKAEEAKPKHIKVKVESGPKAIKDKTA